MKPTFAWRVAPAPQRDRADAAYTPIAPQPRPGNLHAGRTDLRLRAQESRSES